ncbi:MAG TPA: ABC transporter ATP-binding protein [Thermoplasmata archaeon]|nr:ABC transporter ATP-binding protein [Thermoplasmata archaeon]
MSNSDVLVVEGLSASWSGAPVLDRVSFRIGESELVTLLGPNGSGKTTLLRCLVGLERTVGGQVSLRGRSLDRVPPHQRGIGLLSQEPALFPRRTVFENVAYGLEIARASPAAIDARVSELLGMLHLTGLGDRMATHLSGGERQRVALARTLAPAPGVVLLDEPFAAMDPAIRGNLMAEFRDVLRRTGTAALHVTHDREEGLFLGDRVLLLLDGRLRQAGPPVEVYQHPADRDVAAFLGYNVVEWQGRVLAILPSAIGLVAPGMGKLDAEVVTVGTTGEREVVFLRGPGDLRWRAEPRDSGRARPVGSRVGLDWTDSVPIPGGGARDDPTL